MTLGECGGGIKKKIAYMKGFIDLERDFVIESYPHSLGF